MAQLMTCPDAATFQKLIRAEASDEALEAFVEHVSHCSACAEAVERSLAGDTLANAVRAQTTLGEPPKPPAALLDRLLRLCRPDGQRPTHSDATAAIDTAAPAAAACVSFDFLAPPQATDEIGRLGGYRVLKLQGAGGMGLVFQAEDLRLRRMVALKVMKPEAAATPTARERFLREAQAAAAIEHEHIVTIHHVGEDRGVPFLAMQWLKGISLDDWLKQEGSLPTAAVLRIGRQIALGLAAAHEQGLIHRDIKPANIWLETPTGEPGGVGPGRVKLLDFGLARAQADEAHLTQSGAIMGTPAYMAPEQARGEKVDHRCDLFSLGVVLYRMATGQLPFRGGNTLAVLSSLAVDTPAPPRALNAHCPEELSQLIMSLLEKAPAKRPASAREVVAALDRLELSASTPGPAGATAGVASPIPAEARGAARRPAPRQPPRRRMLAIAAGLLFLIGGGVFFQQIFVRITDKDGKTRDIELKPGDRIEIVEKPAPVETPPKPTPEVKIIAGDPDRRAAEYVLSIGGAVRVNDLGYDIWAAAELPKEPFRLTWAHFQDCKNLTVLDLGETPVTDAGLAHFKDCRNLTYLNLDRTPVTDAGLAHFKDCKNLTGLILNGTPVTDAGLAHFKDCKNLTGLELNSTPVTDAGLAHFKDCRNLTYLNLDRTPVTDAGLAHFKDCKNLTQLDLGGTRVTDATLEFLALQPRHKLILHDARISRYGYDQLKAAFPKADIQWSEPNRRATEQVLALGGTVEIAESGKAPRSLKQGEALPEKFFQIRRVVLKDCQQPPGELINTLALLRFPETDRLEAIELFHTRLQSVEVLAGMPKLQRLVLDGNPIFAPSLKNLAQCAELTDLSLAGAGVSDLTVASLAGLKGLKRLSLANTGLSDAGLKHLEGLAALEHLDLSGTKVTADGVAALKQALPKCEVTTDP
jgi:Leucine-rich repeat (LRR) protein